MNVTVKEFIIKSLYPLVPSDESYLSKQLNLWFTRLENLKWHKRLQDAGIPGVRKIFSYTSARELRALYKLASSFPQGAVALEIGSHLGASSCYIAAGLKPKDGHLFCVDTWQNQTMPGGEKDTFKIFQDNTQSLESWITPVRKYSTDIETSDIKYPVHLVFIDGDHSYQGAKNDFELVRDWLAEDGIIAFHDFANKNFEGVTRVVGEALASGKWTIAGQVQTLVWIKRANWSKPAWLSETQELNVSKIG
jgi:predicted O-methyltransferase YrrM